MGGSKGGRLCGREGGKEGGRICGKEGGREEGYVGGMKGERDGGGDEGRENRSWIKGRDYQSLSLLDLGRMRSSGSLSGVSGVSGVDTYVLVLIRLSLMSMSMLFHCII